jgi:hypothetical protein
MRFLGPMNRVGAHFDYRLAPHLFSGRVGEGPLRIMWDTNILIDYLQFGEEIWEDEAIEVDDEEYAGDLDALRVIIQVWQRRDLRFTISELSVDDARSRLASARRRERATAIDQVAAALSLDRWDEDEDPSGSTPAWHASAPTQAAAMRKLPTGLDRELVAEALTSNQHVFLTRDAKILKAHRDLSVCGLLLARPLDLLEEITACGGLDVMLEPRSMWWPLPDIQRTSHLRAAVPRRDEAQFSSRSSSI